MHRPGIEDLLETLKHDHMVSSSCAGDVSDDW